MTTKIGEVTERRYEQLVHQGRDLVKQKTQVQFRLGDNALEIEPMRPVGESHGAGGDELMGVEQALRIYAEDIGIPFATLDIYRWVSSKWPEEHRRSDVSHHIHKILASAPEPERYKLISTRPLNKRSGERRWTIDMAKREVGQTPHHPVSTQEKINRINDLARDDEVASRAAISFLHRPTVASRAMSDQSARHQVNRAQVDRAQQAGEVARQRTPAIAQLEHAQEFVDLVGACTSFVTAVGRVLPTLRGHQFTDDEHATVDRNLARVRATADWLETAVNTGEVSFDEGLATMLRDDYIDTSRTRSRRSHVSMPVEHGLGHRDG
jgi:hypothetical protein